MRKAWRRTSEGRHLYAIAFKGDGGEWLAVLRQFCDDRF
jgi:hypothetical protein